MKEEQKPKIKRKYKNRTSKHLSEKKVLKIARELTDEERIKAYLSVNRSDLAKKYANELLIGEGFNYGRGPQAFDPFSYDRWEILRRKKEFDEKGIPYDLEAVKTGVKNTYCSGLFPPYQEKIQTIETILKEYGLTENETHEFFTQIRDRARYDSWVDETGDFVFRLEETEYSALAAHTGIPRKEVVGHYLNNLFRTRRSNGEIDTIGHLCYVEDLETKLYQFMQKENVEAEEIISRAIRAVEDYRSEDYTYSRPYILLNMLSKIPGVRFPKSFVVKILKDYIGSSKENVINETFEGLPVIISSTSMQDDPLILNLRRESILREIERGYGGLVKRANYAISQFGFNSKRGKLKYALKRWIQKYKNSTFQSELEEIIQAHKRYGILSQRELRKFEERVGILNRIQKE